MNKNKLLFLIMCVSLVGCKVTIDSSNTNPNSNLSSNDSNPSNDIQDSSSISNSTQDEKPSSPSVDSSTVSTPDKDSSPVDSTPNKDSSSSSDNSSTPDSSIPDDEVIDVNVTDYGYSFESAYIEWEPYNNATGYSVYCDNKKVDAELTRNYTSYYRTDILGLTDKLYDIKVVPIVDNKELVDASAKLSIKPIKHVREGFAFVNGTASGAYNEDGTLKSNAKVFYIDNNNKDTITAKIKVSSSKTQDCIGVQAILSALKKGYETTPFTFRFIGNITDFASMSDSNSSINCGGDMLIDLGENALSGITIEGVGNDTTFNGFGLRIKNSSNVEVRNIGFMNCDSDEGDNVSLQQNNHHVWVHNCDFFYGFPGSDADQVKGDGALDTKTSTNITHSYNHFWDSGKSNLQGMKSESTSNTITYHHNWYDHSDSRHPRIRTCTVHIYNNYFDGNSKYGVGATMGASAFVENNYFRNCSRPMLISMQGSDTGTFSSEDGGIIKAYGNTITGGKDLITYSENKTSFDYYDAKSRNETISSSIKTKQGGHTYNNFDTASTMYSYNVSTPEVAKDNVIEYAGRVQGGDFKWTFTSADDSSYDLNTELSKALKNYKGFVPGNKVDNDGNEETNPDLGDDDKDNEEDKPITTPSTSLTFSSISEDTLTSSKVIDGTFTIQATSAKTVTLSNETIVVDGTTYTKVLRLGGSGNKDYRSIKLTLTGAATIKVIAKNNSDSERKLGLLDSSGDTLTSYASPIGNPGILTYTVNESGTYYIASLNSGINLYGIIIEYK